MFEVGDKVIHPAHGAGVVVGIEIKKIVETFNQYYIIDLVAADRQLMIPVKNAEAVGLRPIVSEAKMRRILDALRSPPDDLPHDFRERQAHIGGRLKSGQVMTVAEVVRNLFWLNWQKRLSSTESRFFKRAKQMLAGELALVKGVAVEEAMKEIDDLLSLATLTASR